jgi:beta-N-acetylhexosaminidase
MLEQLLSLPIEKKIGQLFFIGVSGVDLDENTRALLEEVSPGGVCLFSRNIRKGEQVRFLLDEIRASSEIVPFLSLDQEGGTVDRLRRVLVSMPPASLINSIADAEKSAAITAEVVRILGFNMNFAPVVDVVNDSRGKSSNGLYSRSFGKTTEETIRLSGAYLQTLQAQGCIGCLKHFPGLGASEVDSHEELPLLSVSKEELFGTDLQPYCEIINQGQAFVVMIAHAGFPLTDLQEKDSGGKLLPSSLSFNFVTKLLREELNFNGLTITDDLEMGAIVKNYNIGEACKTAILAGEDMLAICADGNAIKEGFNSVCKAVDNGEITEQRIDESLRRIAHLKSMLQPPLPFSQTRLESISNEISVFNKTLSYGG